MRKLIIALVFSLAYASAVFGIDNLSLTPTYIAGDGQFATTTISGQPVWQSTNGSFYLYFQVPATFTFTMGTPVYVQIVYYDAGYGTLQLQYDSTYSPAIADQYHPSETHTRSSRVNSLGFVSSYQQLLKPKFAHDENSSTDFRLAMFSTSPPLSVQSVTIQNSPFSDPTLQNVLSKPWLSPYTGPTQSYVTNSTLNHKVMVGYQGWFRAPNDLADQGWVHWCRTNDMQAKDFTTDMWPALSSEHTNLNGFWPDVTAFSSNELFRAQDVLTKSGQPAYLFSSTTKETVRRHFQWMHQYNIDGAFLQRFASPTTGGYYGYDEWVLAQTREAAHQEGRIWAIEYDISSLADSNVIDVLTNDWKWLCDVVGIRNDSRYAYENGKPVVFIWGLPFSDRGISMSNADAVVDWFHTNSVYGGNYVIGGVPNTWRSMTTWFPHFQKYNGILVWQATAAEGNNGYSNDVVQCNTWGIDYFPHVWPGFSWANLMKQTGNTQLTPRQGGAFYWNQIYLAEGSGASRLFVGMFDEYDEGTAIMPMTDDPPPTSTSPTYGRFITNENHSVDWWMTLTSEARDMLLKQRPYVNTNSMPTEASTTNRANIGSQAWIDLGATNQSHLLYLVPNADGNTLAETLAGRDCVYNANPTNDHYFYFHVDPSYAFQAAGGLDVTIDVEYYDRSNNVTLDLQYDGANGVNTVHPKQIQTQGSTEWRIVRYNIADAYFGGRQNGGADFRVQVVDNLAVHLDRIWVTALPLLTISTNNSGFVINRAGDTNQAVTARYAISGTASNGVDYGSIPSSIIIPPGVGSATIPITPVAQSNQTVALTLINDLAYSIGATSSATVTLQGTQITLSPSTLPGGTVGLAYNQTISAGGGSGPYTFGVSSGALPGNLVLNLSTGVLSGTPTNTGSFTFIVQATDSSANSASQSYVLVICSGAITLSPNTLPSGIVGTVYSQTISGSGGSVPYTFGVSGGTLPIGLSLSLGGALSGTLTAAGTYPFAVQGTDANGCLGNQAYSISVSCPTITATITGAPAGAICAGTSINLTVNSSGGSGALSYAWTKDSSAFATTQAIADTPAAGNHTYAVTVTDANGCQSGPGQTAVMVNPAPTITSISKTDVGCNGSSNGTVTVSFSGGTTPYQVDVDAGSFTSATSPHAFTGLGAGLHAVTAQDANGCTTSASITVGTISPANSVSLDFSTNTDFTANFASNGGTFIWNATAGVGSPGGGGVAPPSSEGTALYKTTGWDMSANGKSMTISAFIKLSAGASFPQINLGVSTTANGQFTSASGGSWLSFYLSDQSGLALSALGYNYKNGTTNSANSNLATSIPLVNAHWYMWTVTFNNTSGTGTGAGTMMLTDYGTLGTSAGSNLVNTSTSFGGSVLDVFQPTAIAVYPGIRGRTSGPLAAFDNWSVNAPCPTITLSPNTLPGGTVGMPYSQTIMAGGGTGPYTFNVNSVTLPGGLALNSSGVLSGTPTNSGSFTFTVQATDANCCPSSQTYTVLISPSPFQAWQIQYFGSITNPAAGVSADPDGDGQNNLAEFLAGTNPTNSASSLHIVSVTTQGSDMLVAWATAGGQTNVVQATAVLPDGSFSTNFFDLSPLIIVVGSGDIITNYLDLGAATNFPSRYYRVRLAP